MRSLLIAQQPGTQTVITRPAAQAVAAALLANGMGNTVTASGPSRTLAAATRAIGGQFGSLMIPASVLMAVAVCDRASDAMCPRFFDIFQLALKAGCGFVAH